MGTVSKPYTFTAGNVIFSAQVNSDFDTLYTLVNGNIDNNNINAGAAIDWTKLATTISRNLAFATTYGISTDFTMANNWINQFNQVLPAPMTGTARMVQAYNTSLVAGVWAGRTITSDCIAYITTVANTFEIWYAPSAATPAVPVWTKVYSFNTSTGLIDTAATNIPNGAIIGKHLYSARHVWEPCIQDWMGHFRVAAGAPGTAVINGYFMSSYASSTEIFAPGLAVQLNAIDFPVRFRAACAVAALGNNNGVMRLYNSNTDMIAIQFDGAANTLTAGCFSGGAASPLTTTYNYAANTIIYLTIEVVSASSINFYASTSLNTLGTLIANRTTNIPTTLPLTPYLGNHGIAANTFYTRDVIFEIG